MSNQAKDDSCSEVFISNDASVIKIIHHDDSETAVKIVPSESQAYNPLSGKIETFRSERGKFSVFASASAGCPMKCPFCHLTIKKAKFGKLSSEDVLTNLTDALRRTADTNPEIRNRHMKLSWMGMGEAILSPQMVRDVSISFINMAVKDGLCLGLDGVDVATVMPRTVPKWESMFTELGNSLTVFKSNPMNLIPDNAANRCPDYHSRSRLRLFWSLHSASASIREDLMPGCMKAEVAAARLLEWAETSGNDVIIHVLLLSGRNDSPSDIEALGDFCNKHLPGRELRVLRYNHCSRSTEKEAADFASAVRRLSEMVPRLKVQVSPGKEVQAACGQFIVRQFSEGRDDKV